MMQMWRRSEYRALFPSLPPSLALSPYTRHVYSIILPTLPPSLTHSLTHSPHTRHGILRFQGRPPQLLAQTPVKKRNERKEDKGLRDPQHHQRSNNQSQAPRMRPSTSRGGHEGGSEGVEGAQGEHGQGPEASAGDDGAPFPHTMSELSSKEGEEDVHIDLQAREGRERGREEEGV